MTALALVSAVMLAACGGGGNSADTGAVTSAAAVYAGPISGFGSVVVNGMRFSSVGATLQNDDGQAVNLKQLKLGMTVRINGDVDDSTQQGTARQLEVVHGTRGTVTAVSTSTGTIALLGQTVLTNAATAYQGVANLAALTVGRPVAIYGAQQADGSLLATLVEVKTLNALSLSGLVRGLTATSFQVGTLTVNYSINQVTGTLANGQRVKIKAATTGLTGNTLTATSVQVLNAGSVLGNSITAGTRLKLKGVAETTPVNGVLTVSGTPVNVSTARMEGGAVIVAGQFVEVEGTWDGSTLQATQVELEGYRESLIGGRNELYGAVSNLTGSVAVVNGVTVDLSRAKFEYGLLTQMAVGSYVEIKGNMSGSTLQATKVELKTVSTAAGISYEQYGRVSGFVSVANFMLNGVPVDASRARFLYGNAASISNGVYLEVKGTQHRRGVFVASTVEIKNVSHDD